MTSQSEPVDTGAYIRTSTLFAEKRKVLAPQAVADLAQDIVRRVSSMKHPSRQDPDGEVSDARISALCDALVQSSPAASLQFILDREAEGIGHETILYGYLAAAARMLGARWDADEIGFSEVILGTGHLYSLLRAIQAYHPVKPQSEFSRKTALFAVVPGETHNFGVRLAAETFREAGWRIDLKVDLNHDDLVAHARQTEPSVIGLSLSTEERLAPLAKLVIALRLVIPAAIIGVAPALNMTDEILRKVADIDAVFRDARIAVRDLDWMHQLRV